MQVEQNAIWRDWTVRYKGRRFFVILKDSDGNRLTCNWDKWEVQEKTDDDIEELCEYVFSDSSVEKQREAEQNRFLKAKLIRFCIDNWDNDFIQNIQDELQALKASLEEIESTMTGAAARADPSR